jgi:pyruvate formate lyase activating enzyme
MKKEARFWEKLENSKVKCNLCSHNCIINEGNIGFCGIRKNEGGKLFSLIYGTCSSMAVDPIEKKPLYHFYPGSKVFSMGTVGCNFKCLHCQNSDISTADTSFPYLREITAEDSIQLAKEQNCQGVAFTYNEPCIWYEFTFDSAKIAKENGLYTCYVTNGYISENPLRDISDFLDAMNIDIKAFTEDFYKKVCKAKLKPVLDTCILAKTLDIHIELTYLVIPGFNDSIDEIKNFSKWIIENLGEDTPVHFSRFHPDYNMINVSATPISTMENVYNIAVKSNLNFVYLGNLTYENYNNTFCPNCGSLIVERSYFDVKLKELDKNRCRKCGFSLPFFKE